MFHKSETPRAQDILTSEAKIQRIFQGIKKKKKPPDGKNTREILLCTHNTHETAQHARKRSKSESRCLIPGMCMLRVIHVPD